MIKKLIISLIVVLILICGIKMVKNKKVDDTVYTKLENEGTISGISYKIYEKYNQGRYDYSKRGYYIDTFNYPNAPWFYVITMGEKNTGGYDIYITDLKIDKNRNVEVIVKEVEPNHNDIVTMAFTYPACCLELSEYAKSIVIRNTQGDIFEKLN